MGFVPQDSDLALDDMHAGDGESGGRRAYSDPDVKILADSGKDLHVVEGHRPGFYPVSLSESDTDLDIPPGKGHNELAEGNVEFVCSESCTGAMDQSFDG